LLRMKTLTKDKRESRKEKKLIRLLIFYLLSFIFYHFSFVIQSLGVILCASKEDEVVEYAMSRNISPTMISEYNLKLIDKKILEQKLREYKELLPMNTIEE